MKELQFANFVCRFGEHLEMQDLLENVVLPAFLDDAMYRTYAKKVKYFFYRNRLVTLDKKTGIIGVTGTFVRDTNLERTHVFDSSSGIRENPAKIESATFGHFLLILNNHKLLYLPMTPYAPSLDQFQTTIAKFMKQKREQFIRQEKETSKNRGSKRTLKGLRHELPKPTVNIIPLVSNQKIDWYLDQFKVLKSIKVNITPTNSEADYTNLVNEIRNFNQPSDPEYNELRVVNNQGLDTDASKEPVRGYTSGENVKLTLDGVQQGNAKLSVSNENFVLKKPYEHVSEDPRRRAERMFEDFRQYQSEGFVKPDRTQDRVSERAQRLVREANSDEGDE